MSFPGFAGCITVKWCWSHSDFLILPDCSSCSVICLNKLCHYINFIDDYLSKISLCQFFVKAPKVNLTLSRQYRHRCIWSKILWYLIFFISPRSSYTLHVKRLFDSYSVTVMRCPVSWTLLQPFSVGLGCFLYHHFASPNAIHPNPLQEF